MSQLILRHGVQDIALILAFIKGLFQYPASSPSLNLCVMPRHDHVTVQEFRPLIQTVEFQESVAVDARIGRSSLFITVNEPVDDLLSEIRAEVKHIMTNSYIITDITGVLGVVQRTAGPITGNLRLFIIKKAHRSANAFISFVLHQPGGYTGIHSAAHRDQCFHTILLLLIFRSGRRSAEHAAVSVEHAINYTLACAGLSTSAGN